MITPTERWLERYEQALNHAKFGLLGLWTRRRVDSYERVRKILRREIARRIVEGLKR